MQPTNLSKRLFAEALGTALLIIAVVGSGIMATNLTDDVALQLLANAGATVGALIALILMFGPISGANFNPVVTAASCIFDARPWRELLPYAVSQTIGGTVGAAIANSMFSLDILRPSTKIRRLGYLARRNRRNCRLVARDFSNRSWSATRVGAGRSRRVDRRRLLVHVIDIFG